jgi:hypothetical protein
MSDSLTLDARALGVEADPVPAEQAEPPCVLDTYALLYALTLVLLVPSVLAISQLPFRDYTFAYVTLVALPGLLGLLAVFFTDSRDPLKTVLTRAAVLAPLVAVSGVTILFTSSFVAIPISQVLKPNWYGVTGPLAVVILIALASPLVPALVRRFRLPLGWRSVVHVAALVFAIAIVAGVAVLSLRPDRTLATMERKDITIYIVGALVWYLPSFGVAAGIWRRLGLV